MAEQDTQDPENLKEDHTTKVIVEMPEDTVKKLLELQKEAKEKGEDLKIGEFTILDVKEAEQNSKQD